MRISFPFVLAVILAFGVGWYMLSGDLIVGGRGPTEASPPPPAERVAEAATTAVRVRANVIRSEERIQTLEVRGRTVADASVAVAAETTGRIIERPVQLGDRVKKGDLLCRLDSGAREARVDQAAAALEQATSDLEAAQQLNQKGFTTDIRVKTLKAQSDTATAELREARLELDRTDVRSPIDGVAESNLAEIGSMLSAGATCALVMNPDPMLVVGQVSERVVEKLQSGMTAKVDLITGQTRSGEITFIGSAADEETRTFRIEISIPNEDFALRAGVTANASIKLPGIEAHHFSPAYLTLDDMGRIGVRVVDAESRARFLPVQILSEDHEGVWVAGLPETVRVITVGQEFVSDGEVVEPVIETANAEAQQ